MSITIATVYSDAFPTEEGARRQPCQLIVIEGPDMGRALDVIAGKQVMVGTGEACDLVLSDERVSREHFTLELQESGGVVGRDLESLNGTIYQGSRLTQATLPIGATLKLGHSFLRLQPGPRHLDLAPSQQRKFGEMVAESLSMRELFAVLELAAPTPSTILIEGETGTGKELCARAIHEHSERRQGPFVAVDCGALPEDLLDSELFGHVRGAFTGAAIDRAGAFQRASGGTIFLDELSGISLKAQARLLRVLEERRVRPVGADREVDVDVRVVAASTRGLEQRVTEGTFRPDLFYRLAVVRVQLPPLRSRREDIPLIVGAMMRQRGMSAGEVAGDNLHRLMAHTWPGNVRELRNIIERAIALSPGATSFDDLRLAVHPRDAEEQLTVRTDLPYSEAKRMLLEVFEYRYLHDLITRCQGNISVASREANIDRKHLRDLLRRNNLVD